MYIHDLQHIGLSTKEAHVYAALLKVDRSSAVDLSRKTGIKQPTVYVIIDTLKNKGLVKEITVGKRPFYEAENPDMLRTLVAEEKAKIDRKMEKLETLVASLKTLDRGTGSKPVVRFHEGKEALKKAVDEYTSIKEFSDGLDYGIYSYDLLDKLFSKKELMKIDQARVENNGTFRAIYTGAAKYIQPENKDQELMKIDQERFPIECDISIFNDEVRLFTLGSKTPSGIFIKNKEIATTLKSLINYIFSQRQK